MENEKSFGLPDLKFFGAVGASISHEMKNVLAIINEMMGLLEDLSSQKAAGRPLEAGRLQQIAGRMKAQVERGNGIMSDLNRFAHTIDHEADTVDLADMIEFVCCLNRRRAALRNVELKTIPAPEPVSVTTNPFALAHLIWACLQRGVALTAPGAVLEMRVEVSSPSRGPGVRFVPRVFAPDKSAGRTIDDACSELAARSGASLSAGAEGELKLQLKARLQASNE